MNYYPKTWRNKINKQTGEQSSLLTLTVSCEKKSFLIKSDNKKKQTKKNEKKEKRTKKLMKMILEAIIVMI